MECIRRVRVVRRGVSERLNDLELLDRRARPPVGHDERQRILMLGARMDEVDVHPVDLGDEVRQGREAFLEVVPVVIGGPIGGHCLDRVELHSLRGIRLAVGPKCRRDASTEVYQLIFRRTDLEGANLGATFDCATHHDLRRRLGGFEKDNDKNG